MVAAVKAEGWAAGPEEAQRLLAAGDVGLEPANEHATVVAMAAALGPAQPVYVVASDPGGTTAYAPLGQGPGEVAWFGMETPAAVARLEFLRDAVAPVLAEVLRRAGPLDVLAVAAQGVAMGDDVHVRTQAATNVLLREWLPHLVAADHPRRGEVARFLAQNHLFFLTVP